MVTPPAAQCAPAPLRAPASLIRCVLSASLVLALLATCGLARADASRLRLRASIGMGTMTSTDQLDWLEYNLLGVLGEVQVGYEMLPWLEAQAGLLGGGFLSVARGMGGLLAPSAGFRVLLPNDSARPYIYINGGPGFTGDLVRPTLSAGVGIDLQITPNLALGPVLNYGQVVQWQGLTRTTDAKFLWLGLSLAFRPTKSDVPPVEDTPPPKPVAVTPPRQTPPRQTPPRQTPPRPAGPPPPPVEPSPEILALIERTLPDPRRDELLALVLFEYDSDRLEPVGIGMLHEVVRVLQERPEIELIEIQGYADNRGDPEYNQRISARRAQRVHDWLIEHGVDARRLQVSAAGATHFVEPGDDEQAHTQNRRVVFRILRMETP